MSRLICLSCVAFTHEGRVRSVVHVGGGRWPGEDGVTPRRYSGGPNRQSWLARCRSRGPGIRESPGVRNEWRLASNTSRGSPGQAYKHRVREVAVLPSRGPLFPTSAPPRGVEHCSLPHHPHGISRRGGIGVRVLQPAPATRRAIHPTMTAGGCKRHQRSSGSTAVASISIRAARSTSRTTCTVAMAGKERPNTSR
jgi:hypothetical protein